MTLRLYYDEGELFGLAIWQNGTMKFEYHTIDPVDVGYIKSTDFPYTDELFLTSLFTIAGIVRPVD